MTAELAEHVSALAAPIYAALLTMARDDEIEDQHWQRAARAAALRQAKLLWDEALLMED